MMKCFFTSDPVLEQGINPANGLLGRLRASVPAGSRVLFICSDPDGYGKTDFFAAGMKACFENSGFRFSQFISLDHRNHLEASQLVRQADFIILAGGHVPTQNRFFHEIRLRSLLEGFHGVLLGISAGTMNAAEVVYAHPEREGEAVDPSFRKFLPGLGLTRQMVLPHYQQIKDDVLDGLQVFEDIAYPDSIGRKFYALVDGSFILSEGGRETLYGEAYLIENGKLTQISREDGTVRL
ncbi:MAG: Type 1 glutamine amidotransferase-like domain-containing protein [Eubacteriales bacterium]|nr:Type 1 glutamine amidotransferase-like domain-containing protein [Eubacteriales bacterium]